VKVTQLLIIDNITVTNLSYKGDLLGFYGRKAQILENMIIFDKKSI
jgi:hypothetical protein